MIHHMICWVVDGKVCQVNYSQFLIDCNWTCTWLTLLFSCLYIVLKCIQFSLKFMSFWFIFSLNIPKHTCLFFLCVCVEEEGWYLMTIDCLTIVYHMHIAANQHVSGQVHVKMGSTNVTLSWTPYSSNKTIQYIVSMVYVATLFISFHKSTCKF